MLRDLCEKEIAPYAADVDEKARYTNEALAALTASGFAAIHVPEEYGGQGGDSVAACIVIEEVARVCASSSLIPICNKLGTMGLLMRGAILNITSTSPMTGNPGRIHGGVGDVEE